MRAKLKRLFWILDAFLLLGTFAYAAYRIATRVMPLRFDEQAPYNRKVDPQAQILEYYRQYPERYLRISKETWQYDQRSRTAFHSFTIKNTATVPYTGIELRFSYESSAGQKLKAEIVKIDGTLTAFAARELKHLRVKNVPASAVNVVVSVEKAAAVR